MTVSLATASIENRHEQQPGSSCKDLEVFCKAVVDLASANKKVNAVNYSKSDGTARTFGCTPTVVHVHPGIGSSSNGSSSSAPDTNNRVLDDKVINIPTSEGHLIKTRLIRGDLSDSRDADNSSSRSPRPRRTQPVATKEKNFVKYNMSKTPNFRRKAPRLQDAMEPSVIWIPQGREEWFDCTDELASLCAEASLRWALNPKNLMGNSILVPPSPLSKAYIRERLDIDDPLRGYQIRHSQGGWLQGFIIWTTFTTWTRYFEWNSLHAESGMSTMTTSLEKKYDVDGKLAKELESLSRSGDPLKGGVIWQAIAEIGLVGGLGCGEFLLNMALQDIASQGCYKYVVLQATETSWQFYEKFGFVRIGAVCTYGQSDNVCGYRHWTYPDEKNLDTRHGGPSYMMAKKIQPTQKDCTTTIPIPYRLPTTGIWEALQAKIVPEKPTILPWTKQDDFIVENPNPYVPAIVDRMKKANTRCKKITAETCNHLMVALHLPQQHHTVKSLHKSSLPHHHTIPRKEKARQTLAATNAFGMNSSKNESVEKDDGNMRDYKRRKLEGETGARNTDATLTRFDTRTDRLKAEAKLPQEDNFSDPMVQTRSRRSTCNQPLDTIASVQEKPRCRMVNNSILKQKFTERPNAKDIHPFFFNKVVTPKHRKDSGPYYFVVHYEKTKNQLTLIQLEPCGNFLGKLSHRTRWRAIGKDSKDKRSLLKVCDGSDYEVVAAKMITKSCCVHGEGWDIL